MNNVLEVRGLTKNYPGFSLQNVSFSLPAGCIMGFIGENGAGKSTTIRLLLGLAKPDGGEAVVLGSPNIATDRELKEHIGVVLDESYFPTVLNLKQINNVLARCYRTFNPDAFAKYAKQFSLPANKPVKDYSRGMRMKLTIAAALSHDSRLLVLDEATSGLDPVVRDEILDVFLDFIQDESHSILLSSHILSDLEKACDYITFLHKGHLVFSEAKDELLNKYVLMQCSEEVLSALPAHALAGVRRNSFGVQALALRQSLPRLDGLVIETPTIEDIMLYTVKEEDK